jgi:hypothetical protein
MRFVPLVLIDALCSNHRPLQRRARLSTIDAHRHHTVLSSAGPNDMTLSGREIHVWLITLLMIATLSACASTPPPQRELDAAADALAQAQQAKAGDYAPVELDKARELLAAAKVAATNRDNARALSLAESAELEATLALARSRAAVARAAVSRGVEENARLRRELLGNGERQ